MAATSEGGARQGRTEPLDGAGEVDGVRASRPCWRLALAVIPQQKK